jgi:hypothetical protein
MLATHQETPVNAIVAEIQELRKAMQDENRRIYTQLRSIHIRLQQLQNQVTNVTILREQEDSSDDYFSEEEEEMLEWQEMAVCHRGPIR